MSRSRHAMARATRALLLGLGVIAWPVVGSGVGEDPGAEVAEALRSLGPPGVLWGRLIVDEESPVGAWTPVAGVQVTLYPATPALVSELERIRQSARDSGALYESAVARVQEVLAVHQARLDGKNPETLGSDGALPAEPPLLSPPVARPAEPPPTVSALRRLLLPGRTGAVATPGQPTEVSSPHPWRQNTDPTGLFAFESLPSGDWLVVAVRIAAYGGQRVRASPPQSGRGRGFLPRATGPAREAEIWVVRVRVGAAERVGLELTDRARWLAGPVR